MPMIMPITELRNTTELSSACHKINEPIFITKNGYGDLAVMSIETYEKNMALMDVYKKLLEAEQQIDSGELLDAKQSLKELRKKYAKKGKDV